MDDTSQLELLIEQIESEISKVGADGAYDTEDCWDLLEYNAIKDLIPPRDNAVYWAEEEGEILAYERNKVVEIIDEIGQ